MDKQKQGEISKKITKHEFYFENPLYDVVENERLGEKLFSGDVDAYSAKNKIDTTYRIEEECEEIHSGSYRYKLHKITLGCKRKDDDELIFFVYSDNEKIIKIGQLPSMVDIQFAKISKKYDRVLSKESLKEFKRAIGLAAHGVGVGSFVYLRRIFEGLIYESFNEHEQDLRLGIEDFLKKRMEEKIELLKDYLPTQLIEMKNIYSILSKGIHELDEQECLQYFSALKLSIELILDQKIEMEIKRKKDEEVKKQIQDIAQSIK